jgi:hypothetical protein
MHIEHLCLYLIQKKIKGDRTKGDTNDPNAIRGQQNLVGGWTQEVSQKEPMLSIYNVERTTP